jgi:hypothetical protein
MQAATPKMTASTNAMHIVTVDSQTTTRMSSEQEILEPDAERVVFPMLAM